jgi:hypothetical protein
MEPIAAQDAVCYSRCRRTDPHAYQKFHAYAEPHTHAKPFEIWDAIDHRHPDADAVPHADAVPESDAETLSLQRS